MSSRQGVEIDYCPSCRGVWLDRGELDKLLERSADVEMSRAAPAAAPVRHGQPPFVDSDYGHHGQHGQRRRKSWLSDIFD